LASIRISRLKALEDSCTRAHADSFACSDRAAHAPPSRSRFGSLVSDASLSIAALVLILPLTALLVSISATARTWNIRADRSGDAPTIQAGVDSAAVGDTVLVWPGTYIGRIRMRSRVALVSQAGAAQTILSAAGTTAIDAGRSAIVEGILVQGFTITGTFNAGFGEQARTIHVWGSALVRDCVIRGNSSYVAGAHLRDGDLRILDTRFFDNFGGSGDVRVSGVSCAGGYLVVTRCTFENQTQGVLVRTEGGIVEFRDNVVRNCSAFEILEGTEDVLIYNSLFDRVPFPITVGNNATTFVLIRQNTFARAGPTGAALGPALGTNTVVDRNVMTGALRGLWLCCPGPTVTCNDSWGNTENWVGRGDLDQVDGNFSLQPMYCDATNGVFTVAANSPLLPENENNPCHEQIGAFPQGCAPLSVNASSWGHIKGRYRRDDSGRTVNDRR
jgi:hypothetical protein